MLTKLRRKGEENEKKKKKKLEENCGIIIRKTEVILN